MDSAAPGHDDAVPAQRNLRHDIGPLGIFGPHGFNLLIERQFLGDGLQRGKGHRQAGFAAEVAHPLKFIPLALQVGCHFKHPVADAAHCPSDAEQFILGRGGARDQHAVDRPVQHGARCRKAERTGPEAVFHNL